MARPPAPCGTYSAYKRHRRKHETVDPACEKARDERTAADAAARKASRAEKVAAATAPPVDDDSDWDGTDLFARIRGERSRRDHSDAVPKTRAERLQWNLDLIEAAMEITGTLEPSKLAPLSKRHSELLDELHRIDGDKPVKDPLDEFFGDGGSNVVGISTASSRKQA
jgi:hypothetical protein